MGAAAQDGEVTLPGMTISKDCRTQNIDYALTLFVNQVNDNAIDNVTIRQSASEFADVLPTTWQELRDRYWLHQIKSTDIHWMTGAGWYAGVKAAGKCDEPLFREQMSRLAATLKRLVKDREQETVAVIDAVAIAASVPIGFVYNAIESRLLDREFKMVGASWSGHSNPRVIIRIPINFGHSPL